MLSKLVYLVVFVQINAQTIAPPTVLNFSIPAPKRIGNPEFNCFIDEHFVQEIEIFHIIGVRKNGSLLKITEQEEEFAFDFFYPRDGQNVVIFPTTPKSSMPNPPTVSSSASPGTPSNASTLDLPRVPNNQSAFGVLNSSNSTGFPSLDNVTVTTYYNTTTYSDQSIPESFVDGITVAVEVEKGRFHFVVPDELFRYYRLLHSHYKQQMEVWGEKVSFEDFEGIYRRRRFPRPVTCHFNIHRNETCCVAIVSGTSKTVTVGSYGMNDTQKEPKEISFNLPDYLSFNEFHSYADASGGDFILFHHKGEWIYRFNIQQYFATGNLFFKVFHLRSPAIADFEFHSFEHADENGLVTKYRSENGLYRYFYSLFSEVSGLPTFCVHDKPIEGTLMIIARKRMAPEQGMTAELRSLVQIEKGEELEFPTMLRVLFYCTLVYLTVFIGAQMMPVRKIRIGRELRRLEREVQRVAPVVEVIVGKVHAFLETEKIAAKHKQY